MHTIETILRQSGIHCFGFAPMPPRETWIPCRAASRLPADPQSAIVCLFPYYMDTLDRNISLYAAVADYHVVVGAMLRAACVALEQTFDARFVPFVDNSPIPEVATAVSAGLGLVGRHGLLITESYGSFVFIGEIITNQVLPYASPNKQSCLNCGKCVQHCPNQALGADGLKLQKCISHITQKKGDLTADEIDAVIRGGLLWGCDRCQEVCPHNRRIPPTTLPAFSDDVVARLEYDQIEKLSQHRAFGFRGPGVIRRNYRIIYPDRGKIEP